MGGTELGKSAITYTISDNIHTYIYIYLYSTSHTVDHISIIYSNSYNREGKKSDREIRVI